jgi:uncharacterized repeat protein (TIGR03803 family)
MLAFLGMAWAQGPASEVVLHNFAEYAPQGSNPATGVFRDADGNLYGTTGGGGTAGQGVVYKVDTAGNETVLYTFSGGAAGGTPGSGVVRDAAGNLYGTESVGYGAVYKVDSMGHRTVLHAFTGDADGSNPESGVILDNDGNLYGTTYAGGTGAGVVYKLDATGQETVLYSFTGQADGDQPWAGVIRDAAGNLYGATRYGGTAHSGVVYKVDPSGKEIVLYSFQGGTDAANPEASLIRDADGNLYGTTQSGGTGGYGTVYKVDAAGRETVLYNFTATSPGTLPLGNVVRDREGNLYGVSSYTKTLFKLDPAGQFSVFYTFPGAQYSNAPNGGLILDAAGNFYGTTGSGGSGGAGAVFKVDAAGRETVLHSFLGAGLIGDYPQAGVVRDAAGNLYGTTYQGGRANRGVIYKVDPIGHETVLHNFTGVDGSSPSYSMTMDAAGNLYGATSTGGNSTASSCPSGCGVVYKMDPAGGFTVLYTFTGEADGGLPVGGVIVDAAGNVYGTTIVGGSFAECGHGCGVVYKLDPAGSETVLYTFMGGAAGSGALSGVTMDAGGNLYGTAGSGQSCCGLVYKLDSTGNETVLHTFYGNPDGAQPSGNLILDAAGNIYGTTAIGGEGCSFGCGVIYKVDPAGNETVVHRFTGEADGASPVGVALDATGNFFGVAGTGGAGGWGTVYKVDPFADNTTVLYSFTDGADGGSPGGAVILGPNGALFGTATRGGTEFGGVVFKVIP